MSAPSAVRSLRAVFKAAAHPGDTLAWTHAQMTPLREVFIAEALGATETIFPERQAATNLASRLTSSKLLHYASYGEEFGIQEMAVPDGWCGKTLEQLRLPQQFQIQVVAFLQCRLAAATGCRSRRSGPGTARA